MTPSATCRLTHAFDFTKVDTVLLDMDGTLLDLHFDAEFWSQYLPQQFIAKSHLPEQQARALLQHRFEHMQGQLGWYCLDDWAHALNTTAEGINLVELKRELAHLIRYRPGVPQFLDELGRLGKKRVLVTNAHPDSVALKFEQVDLGHRLDAIFNAHKIGAAKESDQFWARLAQSLRFNRQRTLLIDDNLQALAAAKRFGIRHLRAVTEPNSRQGPVDTEPFEAFTEFVVAS